MDNERQVRRAILAYLALCDIGASSKEMYDYAKGFLARTFPGVEPAHVQEQLDALVSVGIIGEYKGKYAIR